MAVGFSRVSCFLAAVLCSSDALRRQAERARQHVSDDGGDLRKGADFYGRSNRDTQAYLNGTTNDKWKYGQGWKDIFVGVVKALGRTGVEVDDHDGPVPGPGPGNEFAHGESIGLVSAKVTMDKSQILKLPSQFRTGLFRCGTSSRCPELKAAIRVSDTFTSMTNLMRLAIKINTNVGEVDFVTTETFKSFPIGTRDEMGAIAYSMVHGFPAAIQKFPAEFGKLGAATAVMQGNANLTRRFGALGKNYYTMIPFRLGSAGSKAGAFKMRLVAQQRPSFPGTGILPKQEYKNNMRDQFVENVEAGEQRFSFEIQVASDPSHEINDASLAWNETSAPWIRMGDVVIPRQTFKKPVTSGNVVGSGLWVKKFMRRGPPFNSKELLFYPGSVAHPPVGDIGHFRQWLYPIYDKERQAVLLGKRGGSFAVCPWTQI